MFKLVPGMCEKVDAVIQDLQEHGAKVIVIPYTGKTRPSYELDVTFPNGRKWLITDIEGDLKEEEKENTG